MKTRFRCPSCKDTISIEIQQTTNYKVKFKKDGSASKYRQNIENIEITKKWKINQLYKQIFQKLKPKLQKGIKKQTLHQELRNKHKMDKDLKQAFISKIKKEGVIEKNNQYYIPT